MKKINILLLAFPLMVSTVSFAELVVDDSVVIITDPSQSRYDVTVFNTDETEKLYLEITPHRVVNPGEINETLEVIDFASAPDFLVSPNRAILEPKDETLVRLLNLNSAGEKELVYRINVVPVTPPVELEQPEEEVVRSMLQVVIAYQILVIIAPNNPEPVMDYKREGDIVTFSNVGNSNYLLTEGEQCNPQSPKQCEPIQAKRMYPGNSWTLQLPFDGPANYTLRTHAGSSTRVIN
jgi:P pilus assembly chaperone PapD